MTTPPPGSREAERALDEIEQLLKFYTEPANYYGPSISEACTPAYCDGGKRAANALSLLPTLRAALAPPADGAGEVEVIKQRHEYAEQKGGDLYTPEYCEWSFSQCHRDRATLLRLLSEERARRVEVETKLASRLEPDMFWDQENPETPYWDIEELLREREYDRDTDIVIETSEAIRCDNGAYLCRIVSADEDADDDSPTFSIRKLTEDERKEYRNIERIWYAIRCLKPLFVTRATHKDTQDE